VIATLNSFVPELSTSSSHSWSSARCFEYKF